MRTAKHPPQDRPAHRQWGAVRPDPAEAARSIAGRCAGDVRVSPGRPGRLAGGFDDLSRTLAGDHPSSRSRAFQIDGEHSRGLDVIAMPPDTLHARPERKAHSVLQELAAPAPSVLRLTEPEKMVGLFAQLPGDRGGRA